MLEIVLLLQQLGYQIFTKPIEFTLDGPISAEIFFPFQKTNVSPRSVFVGLNAGIY